MSPSQASETCASASSATSARYRVGHYANASGGCQEWLVPASTPERIAVEITITIAIAATSSDSIPVAIAVAVPAIAPEDSDLQN